MHSHKPNHVLSSQMESEVAIRSIPTQPIIDQCKRLLKQLFLARLVEKLARPIDQSERETMVLSYKQKLEELNSKMMEVHRVQQKMGYPKEKHRKMEAQLMDYNKSIKHLNSQYQQILTKGSFKHYEKVRILYNLSPMDVLDVSKLNNNRGPMNIKSKCCFC